MSRFTLIHKSFNREGLIMKTLAAISVLSVMVVTGCSTTRSGMSAYDDVYYSPRDPVVVVKEVVVEKKAAPVESTPDAQYSNQNEVTDPGSGENNEYYVQPEYFVDSQGNQYITYNFYGDYYDYSYASRIRRFHRPYYFDSYYHDYYTNMYWYNYDPYFWGTSIYIGYGWYPSFHFGYGWGYPGYSWYSDWGWGYPYYYYSWYSPYYSYYYFGYGSYWRGYRHGYWDGYWDGYWNNPGNWYINSLDKNSYYYGPRVGFAGSIGGTLSGSGNNTRFSTFGEKYEQIVATETNQRGSQIDGRGSRPNAGTSGGGGNNTVQGGLSEESNKVVTGEPARGTRTTPTSTGNVSDVADPVKRTSLSDESGTVGRNPSRSLSETQDTQRSAPSNASPISRSTRENNEVQNPTRSTAETPHTPNRSEGQRQQSPTYVKPESPRPQPSSTQRKPQPYSPPRYNKPQSSDEYTAPSYRNIREFARPDDQKSNENRSSDQTRQGVNRNTEPQRFTTPRETEDNRRYAPPARTNPPARTPDREVAPNPVPRFTQPEQPRSTERQQSAPRNVSPPPSRSNENYSPPPPKSAPPSRSNESYSPPKQSSPPPSRSNESFSAPSRSSSSSSGSSGSSSGSGSEGSSSGSGSRGSRR